MKKIICAVTALTIAVCVFAACSKKEKDDTAVSYTDPLASQYYEGTVTQENGKTTAVPENSIVQESSGITIDVISSVAKAGQLIILNATGTPDAEFTIELYNDADTPFVIDGLDKVKSDKDGHINLTFVIPGDAKIGSKALIIRETGTDNYARTAINVTA